jgi:3'-phosphoadenosine 5'-phosphosulfate sulfotransferase (PAPS reductase)/FAD synthetase
MESSEVFVGRLFVLKTLQKGIKLDIIHKKVGKKMKKVLKTKLAKGNSNEQWETVYNHIFDYISEKEIQDFSKETLKEIKSTTKGKKVAFGWSAGKDSVVLASLCHLAGIERSVMALSQLEFPVFERWAEEHRPPNCEFRYTKHDLEWLSKHQNRLFPESASGDNIWFQEIQRNTTKKYYAENELDMILLGRRTADGNHIPSKVHEKKDGQVTYCPIRDWSHELLLGYIVYNKLPMPPIYDWEDGWIYGTHTWAVRRMRPPSIMKSWESVYKIDKNIVIEASDYIESAKEFLATIGD